VANQEREDYRRNFDFFDFCFDNHRAAVNYHRYNSFRMTTRVACLPLFFCVITSTDDTPVVPSSVGKMACQGRFQLRPLFVLNGSCKVCRQLTLLSALPHVVLNRERLKLNTSFARVFLLCQATRRRSRSERFSTTSFWGSAGPTDLTII